MAYLQVPHPLQDSRAVADIHDAVVEDYPDAVVEDSLDEEDVGDSEAGVVEDTQVVRAGEDAVNVVDKEVAVLLPLVVVAAVAVVAEEGSQHLTLPSSSPEPPARN